MILLGVMTNGFRDMIWPFMVRANDDAGWKYNIKAAESTQITRYKKGGFYNFHQDGTGDHLSAYNNPGNEFLCTGTLES